VRVELIINRVELFIVIMGVYFNILGEGGAEWKKIIPHPNY
jgi:hypothetical protein